MHEPFHPLGDSPPAVEVRGLSKTYPGNVHAVLSMDFDVAYGDDPAQPADGFTIRAPSNESEADVLCRAYQKADPSKRKTMRASFEADIARNKR